MALAASVGAAGGVSSPADARDGAKHAPRSERKTKRMIRNAMAAPFLMLENTAWMRGVEPRRGAGGVTVISYYNALMARRNCTKGQAILYF
jgi:hypothetical protein